jgi:hypothetical protein
MRPKTFAVLLLATLCLAPSLAGAAAPSGWKEVRITFDNDYPYDGLGAALKSDGGAYETKTVRNKTQLAAHINPNNGYLFLDFGDMSRKLRMNLSRVVTLLPPNTCPEVSPTPSPNYPEFVPGDFDTRQMLSVVDILSVTLLTGPRLRGVRIGVTDEGPYGMVYLRFDEPSIGCSGKVWVTRLDPNRAGGPYPEMWEIWSPVQPNSVPSGAEGIAVVWQNFATKPGQIDGGAARYVNLPFKFTVTALP